MQTKSILDHERTEHYVLVASASDAGSPPLTATATVYVNVLDVNDEPPKLEKALYSVSVPEDAPAGTVLQRIAATDEDSVSEGKLVFQVEESYRDVFSVTADGDLVTVAALDREREPAYAFRVTVSDGGGGHSRFEGDDPDYYGITGITEKVFTSTCVVEVAVTDVNDQVSRTVTLVSR